MHNTAQNMFDIIYNSPFFPADNHHSLELTRGLLLQ